MVAQPLEEIAITSREEAANVRPGYWVRFKKTERISFLAEILDLNLEMYHTVIRVIPGDSRAFKVPESNPLELKENVTIIEIKYNDKAHKFGHTWFSSYVSM